MTSLPSGLRNPPLNLTPLVIALFALGLRLWGIGWGLPDEGRWFSYHVDESLVTTYSLRLNPLLLLLDPEFYNYGSLSLLLNGLLIHISEWAGLVKPGPAQLVPSASALLTARLLTACLGAGTCLFLCGAGRLFYSPSAGWIAALGYAVAPLAVQHGHFATVDVPATFWVAGTLYFAARHLSSERRGNDLLWAGVFAGLAAATKYNMGLVLLSGIAAWWVAKPRTGARGIGMLLGGALLGFLVGCPGALLNPRAFLSGLLFEANHAREGHGLVFVDTPSGFIYHLTYNLSWALGWPLLVAALVGFGLALARRRPADLALLAFAVPYYVLIGLASVKFARYVLPLIPALMLWMGALAHPSMKRTYLPTVGGLGLAGAVALAMSVAFNVSMTGTDSRDRAAAYIRERGVSSVGFATGPWFFSPTLHPLLGAFNPQMAKQAAAEVSSLRLIPAEGEWNVEQLRTESPDAVALSEFEYGDALRTRNESAEAYVQELQRAYPKRQVFSRPVVLFGWSIVPVRDYQGLPAQQLPHDMMYPNPTTVVFTR